MSLFIAAYLLLGLLVGFMAGLLGIGGGALMVPFFTMLFLQQGVATPENAMHLALGSSMAAIIFTSFASMRSHYKKANVQTDMAVKISTGVLAGPPPSSLRTPKGSTSRSFSALLWFS